MQPAASAGPDFATPFVRGVLYGTWKLLPALLIVGCIMVSFWFFTRRRQRR
jgi:hypothetical protein